MAAVDLSFTKIRLCATARDRLLEINEMIDGVRQIEGSSEDLDLASYFVEMCKLHFADMEAGYRGRAR